MRIISLSQICKESRIASSYMMHIAAKSDSNLVVRKSPDPVLYQQLDNPGDVDCQTKLFFEHTKKRRAEDEQEFFFCRDLGKPIYL
jgi:hypothetical protein